MATRLHIYRVTVDWTGNLGSGTAEYAGYSRDHTIKAGMKPSIAGSSDPAFRGDGARWNPEELLLASISACHKLWYLHLCATSGIAVICYHDEAEATMREDPGGAGRFVNAVLRPKVVIRADNDIAVATRLHHEAHERCFIANSVNFLIDCQPDIMLAPATSLADDAGSA